ncbi:MAG: cupin domain-containing protein [Candidatus Nanopelagicales bacterium]
MSESETRDPGMTDLADLAQLVDVAEGSIVSRTVLRGAGAKVVLFAFDTGEELSEHTAAVPVLLQALSGALDVTADGRTVHLRPGGLIHLAARVPHSVVAPEPARLLLVLLDARRSGGEGGASPAGQPM